MIYSPVQLSIILYFNLWEGGWGAGGVVVVVWCGGYYLLFKYRVLVCLSEAQFQNINTSMPI